MTDVRILCNDCFDLGLATGRYEDVFMAGPAAAPWFAPIEQNILLCVLWHERKRDLPHVRREPCADCGRAVSVAPSSNWLLKS